MRSMASPPSNIDSSPRIGVPFSERGSPVSDDYS